MFSMAKKEDRTRLILENHGLTRLTRDFQHLTIDEPPSRERDEFQLSPQLRARWTEAQLRDTLEGLKHGAECEDPFCKANKLCGRVKVVFWHGINCKVRVEGGCFICKLMWHNLKIHAYYCKDPICYVPCCRFLKQQDSDSRPGAASSS